MKNPKSQDLRSPRMQTSRRRSSRPSGPGFSRPTPLREEPRRAGPLGENRSDSIGPGLLWLLQQLHTLARDDERARSYLAKPGCNVRLGMAHRARMMAKRSCLLRFLREDHIAGVGHAAPSRVSYLWETGTAGACCEPALPVVSAFPSGHRGGSRRTTAGVSASEE